MNARSRPDLPPENWAIPVLSSPGYDAQREDPAMRGNRLTEEQILAVLKEAEGGAKALDV